MKIVKKKWGSEKWVINNEKYCGKILSLKRGFHCSLHQHQIKDEAFYILRGRILMEIGKKKWIMKYGDVQHIVPKTWHRFTGLTDAEIIEFSTHHLETDSYRKKGQLSGKAYLRRAYDYDGTITSGVKPEKEAPIITGRSFEEIDRLNPKLFKNHSIYFNPVTWGKKNLRNAIDWKVLMIKKLGIEEFYENDDEVIKVLKKKCPKVNIIKI